MKKRLCIFLLVLLLPFAYAHGADDLDEATDAHKATEAYAPFGIWTVFGFGVAVLALFSIVGVSLGNHMSEGRKKALYIIAATCIIATTFYFVGTTVMLNLASSTKGPVHWHADFEIWSCGQRVDIASPIGLSNRVGSSVFHEHDDNRIHVEGPVLESEHVSLQEFFRTIGGQMESGRLSVPTNEGMVEMQNGQLCGGQPASLQVFVMRVENPDERKGWKYTQSKLADFPGYVTFPYAQVPPGDCIIIEFGPEQEKTGHLCETYRLAKERGELDGG